MSGHENPPAFPLAVQPDFQFANNGMTLRDWFAGQAMPQLIRQINLNGGCVSGIDVPVAETAYWIADAMLAERAKAGAA